MNEFRETDPELTVKQREVLELLRLHMTSKEVARNLGISPHTVDQRIASAKKKLGAASRSELMTSYMEVLKSESDIYGKPVYKDSYLELAVMPLPKGSPSDAENALVEVARESSSNSTSASRASDIRVVPEVFDGRYGTIIRLGAIIGLAVAIVILALGGLAIFGQLSQLFSE